MHALRLLAIAALFLLCTTSPLVGQTQTWNTSNGVLHITSWPETAENQRSIDSLKVHAAVLPSIDTLSIGYGYRATANRPFLTFALEWKPGPYIILDGERISLDDFKGEVQIESLRLTVDVVSQMQSISSLDFVVDSLMLPSYPGLFSEELTELTWESVFPDLPDSTTKSLFREGFSLENPRIKHISFAYFDEEGNLAEASSPQIIPRRPSRRTVYGPNINIGVRVPVIIYRPTARPRSDDGPRTVEPRGERIGRGDTTDDDRRTSGDDRRQPDRTGNTESAEDEDEDSGADILDATRKKKKKSDDDEDEDELLPAAIAGVAAVAIVAVAGGTVGYFGNTKNAPIGLTAGYVQPEGGVLLQVGINSAVIERSESDTEYFLGKITSFYDLFSAPIQPALGLGVRASEDNGNFEYDFTASVGVVGNYGKLILLGGYDFINGGVDIGLAINLRAKK